MKLNELLEVIGLYQNFQLEDVRAREPITSVTYVEGGSESEGIDAHLIDDVVAVFPDIDEDGKPYLVIRIDNG